MRADAPSGVGQEGKVEELVDEARCRSVAVDDRVVYWVSALTRAEVLRQRRLNLCVCMGKVDGRRAGRSGEDEADSGPARGQDRVG